MPASEPQHRLTADRGRRVVAAPCRTRSSPLILNGVTNTPAEPARHRRPERALRHPRAWRGLLFVGLSAACVEPPVPIEDAAVRDPDETIAGTCLRTGCDIELRHVVTLSDSADPGLFGRRIFLNADSGGDFITTTIGSDRLAVFGREGALHGTIGGQGDGPGEFRLASLPLRGPADSLYVFDRRAARLTVLSPDRQLARTMPFPAQPETVLPDGSFVVVGQMRTLDRQAFALHILDADGSFVRSFGTGSPGNPSDAGPGLARVGGRGSGASIWTTPPRRYMIEQWDPSTGDRLRVLDADPPAWFRASDASGGSAREVRPDPALTQIWEGPEGLVWIVATVADADWAPTEAPAVEGPMSVEDRNRIYDWRIEAVDPATGSSVASLLVREELWIRTPYEYFVSPVGIRGDAVLFDILRPVLRPKVAR